MTFCLVLGTLLVIVSLVLGMQWFRGRRVCQGRWVWPGRVTQDCGGGRLGAYLETPAHHRPFLPGPTWNPAAWQLLSDTHGPRSSWVRGPLALLRF